MTDDQSVIVKKCSTCGESKLLAAFYKNKSGKYGVNSTCKPCVKKKYNGEIITKRLDKKEFEIVRLSCGRILKKCRKCLEQKGVTAFYRNRKMKSGIMSTCKICSDSAKKRRNPSKFERYRLGICLNWKY